MKAHLRQLTLLASALAAIAPAFANAQAAAPASAPSKLLTPYGEYFMAGGGVADYTSSAVKDRTDTSGTWNLRLGFGSRYFVGGEIGYVGTYADANAIGSDLTTNGVEGVLRLQYPYVLTGGRWMLEPFAFGGVGWQHFELSDRTALALGKSDDVFTMPFGGGLTVAYNRLLLDTRVTYRQTFNESLVRDNDGNANLSSWAVTMSVGYEF